MRRRGSHLNTGSVSGNAVGCVEIRASLLDIYTEQGFGSRDDFRFVRQSVRIHAPEARYTRRSLNSHDYPVVETNRLNAYGSSAQFINSMKT